MKVFQKQTFRRFYDQDSARIFSDIEFRKCTFMSSSISITLDPALRSTVRNVRLINCEEIGCSLRSAVVEDVLVDGLKTSDLYQLWGAVFKHVTLKGKIDRIMFSPLVIILGARTREERDQQEAFDKANEAYYRTVDWALDISQAEFRECDIRGIPARLIRRDPKTQVIVTRQRALRGDWRKLDLAKTSWSGWIEAFIQDGEDDVVLIACKRDKNFKHDLEGLKMLRDAGVAEPD